MAYFEHNYTPVLQTMVTVFLLLGESLTSALKHHSAHKYPHVKGLLHSPRLLKKKTLIRQTVENNNGRQLEKYFAASIVACEQALLFGRVKRVFACPNRRACSQATSIDQMKGHEALSAELRMTLI